MKKLLKNLFSPSRQKEEKTQTNNPVENTGIETDATEMTQPSDSNNVARQADTLKFDAVRAMNYGELVFATDALRKAMELRPEFETRYYLAEVLVLRNLYEEALTEMNLLLEEVPAHTATLLNRAKLRTEQHDPEGALEDSRAGIESTSEPEEQALLLYYGAIALKDLHRNEEALQFLNESIEKGETFVPAKLLRIRLLIEEKLLEEARQGLDALSSSHPEEEQVPLLSARLYLEEDRQEEALQDYQRLLELDPFSEEGHQGIASLMLKRGEVTEAETFLREAIEELPTTPGLTLMLIQMLEEQGRKEEAEKLRSEMPTEVQEGEAVNFKNLYSGGLY